MFKTKNIIVQSVGREYTFRLKIPIDLNTVKADYALSQVIFSSALNRAMDELRSGLIRGGVPPATANLHPATYVTSVEDALYRRAVGKVVVMPPEWGRLTQWQPEPGRFDNWFGTPWGNLAATEQEWFRNTILGVILNFVGRLGQKYCFSTGSTSTLGQSYLAGKRFGNHGVDASGQTRPTRLLFNEPAVQALHQNVPTGILSPDRVSQSNPAVFAVHATAMQETMLAESLNQWRDPEMDFKRPSKKKGSSLLGLWTHTLFHELSHGFGNTIDYWYYDYTPTQAFHSWTDSACRSNFEAVRAALGVPAMAASAAGVYTPGYIPNNYPTALALANADTVGAYLAGFWSANEYPVLDD